MDKSCELPFEYPLVQSRLSCRLDPKSIKMGRLARRSVCYFRGVQIKPNPASRAQYTGRMVRDGTSSRQERCLQRERLATSGCEGRICATQAYCKEALGGRALTIANFIKPLGKDGSRPTADIGYDQKERAVGELESELRAWNVHEGQSDSGVGLRE